MKLSLITSFRGEHWALGFTWHMYVVTVVVIIGKVNQLSSELQFFRNCLTGSRKTKSLACRSNTYLSVVIFILKTKKAFVSIPWPKFVYVLWHHSLGERFHDRTVRGCPILGSCLWILDVLRAWSLEGGCDHQNQTQSWKGQSAITFSLLEI